MNEPKVLTIKEAATQIGVTDEAVRQMIQHGLIPGACCWGSPKHRNYYITDAQIYRFKRGIIGDEKTT